jgi:hypothetical protein
VDDRQGLLQVDMVDQGSGKNPVSKGDTRTNHDGGVVVTKRVQS